MISKFRALLVLPIFLALTQAQDGETPKETCKKIGTVCSSDCSKILACTQIDKEPILTIKDCSTEGTPSYCQENSKGAACGGKLCKSGEDTVKVICGTEGRFPHPTNPSASIRCTGRNIPPSKTCYCPIDKKNVDITKPDLPCTAEGEARQPVECKPGSFITSEDNPYSYICKSSTEIIVTIKETAASRSLSVSPFAEQIGNSGTCEDSGQNDPSSSTTTTTTTAAPDGNPDQPDTEPPESDPTTTQSSTTSSNSSTTTTTTTTTTTQRPIEVKCSKRFEALPDPNNCAGYYFCDDSLRPQKRNCSKGRFFFKITRSCVPGSC